MKFNLFHKIFSAFMVTILATIVVLALAMYFSANWRFSEYVVKVEMGALDDLVAALGSVHQEKQSWEQFRENPESWLRFIWLYLPEIHDFPPPPIPGGPRPGEKYGNVGRTPRDAPPLQREHPDNPYMQEFHGRERLWAVPPGPPPFIPRRESFWAAPRFV